MVGMMLCGHLPVFYKERLPALYVYQFEKGERTQYFSTPWEWSKERDDTQQYKATESDIVAHARAVDVRVKPYRTSPCAAAARRVDVSLSVHAKKSIFLVETAFRDAPEHAPAYDRRFREPARCSTTLKLSRGSRPTPGRGWNR
ncbi:hypothetical protein EVAR_79844_1 [Eumeta japonica]|uniref:Uncharacterized protein n=1 Tax=Eumeta variegata TaxID=151549 RepID=A0A4C1TYV5_EUMVA|nr:hypothetical protein EVAR_79844_1 [Eumeta japonica]